MPLWTRTTQVACCVLNWQVIGGKMFRSSQFRKMHAAINLFSHLDLHAACDLLQLCHIPGDTPLRIRLNTRSLLNTRRCPYCSADTTPHSTQSRTLSTQLSQAHSAINSAEHTRRSTGPAHSALNSVEHTQHSAQSSTLARTLIFLPAEGQRPTTCCQPF